MLAFIYSFIHESQNKWILNFDAYLKSQFMIPLQKSIMICLLYIFWILLLCMYWLLLVNVVVLGQIKGWNFGMHHNNNNWNWKLTKNLTYEKMNHSMNERSGNLQLTTPIGVSMFQSKLNKWELWIFQWLFLSRGLKYCNTSQ